MPKLCVAEIDKVLGEIPKGSLVLFLGTAETYIDAVALDIIRRCVVGTKKRALIYVINNEPSSIVSLAESIGFPLRSYRDAGMISIARSTNVISALRSASEEASLNIGEEAYVLIDATAATWDLSPTSLAEAMQAHRRLITGITILLSNPNTIKETTLREMLEEISDYPIKFFSEIESGGITRYLEIRYSKNKVVNFARVHYTITSRGVEYSLQTQI